MDGLTYVRKELRDDFDASSVMAIAAASDDPEVAFRCSNIAALYDGVSEAELARRHGITKAGVNLWKMKFIEQGEKWLTNRRNTRGPASKDVASETTLKRSAGKIGYRTEVTFEEHEKIIDRVTRALDYGERLSVSAVASWLRIELEVSMEDDDIETLLASYSIHAIKKVFIPHWKMEKMRSHDRVAAPQTPTPSLATLPR